MFCYFVILLHSTQNITHSMQNEQIRTQWHVKYCKWVGDWGSIALAIAIASIRQFCVAHAPCRLCKHFTGIYLAVISAWLCSLRASGGQLALCPVRLDCSKIMYGMSVLVWLASPYFLHATGIWAKYTIRDLAENVNARPCLDQSACSLLQFCTPKFWRNIYLYCWLDLQHNIRFTL